MSGRGPHLDLGLRACLPGSSTHIDQLDAFRVQLLAELKAQLDVNAKLAAENYSLKTHVKVQQRYRSRPLFWLRLYSCCSIFDFITLRQVLNYIKRVHAFLSECSWVWYKGRPHEQTTWTENAIRKSAVVSVTARSLFTRILPPCAWRFETRFLVPGVFSCIICRDTLCLIERFNRRWILKLFILASRFVFEEHAGASSVSLVTTPGSPCRRPRPKFVCAFYEFWK